MRLAADNEIVEVLMMSSFYC